MREFVRERELLRIPKTELYDETKWLTKGIRDVDMAPFVQPVVAVDPLNLLIPGVSPQIQQKGEMAEDVPSDNSNPTVTVTTDQKWWVTGISAYMNCAAVAVTRAFRVFVSKKIPTGMTIGVTTLLSFQTSTIDLTTNQDGQITLETGPNHMTNDNGTLAIVTDENPLPMLMEGTATINSSATNRDTGDRQGLKVSFRRVA